MAARLQRMYGANGKKVFRRLEELRTDPDTPKKLKVEIDFFIIERLFGKAPLPVGIESGRVYYHCSRKSRHVERPRHNRRHSERRRRRRHASRGTSREATTRSWGAPVACDLIGR